MLASPVDFDLADAVNFEFTFFAEFQSAFGWSEEEGPKTFAVEIKCDGEESQEGGSAADAAYNHGDVVF